MLGDTIVALASAPGAAERAVLRVSGPMARVVAQRVFTPELPTERAWVDGEVVVAGIRLPAAAMVLLAPRSFTGEDTVELHVPGSPLLVALLQEELLRDGRAMGARQALPGEFTARAVQHGRLDGVEVEGLLLLLHAADTRDAANAVQWLRGGLADAVRSLRGSLQDAAALIEVGLDFDAAETGNVPSSAWLPTLQHARDELKRLLATVPAAAAGGEVLLLGRANAGKSALANALAGRELALVDATPGTTRDLLRIELGGGAVLWDAPGDLDQPGAVDEAALALRERLSGRAAGALLVLDAKLPRLPHVALTAPVRWLGVVWTKLDAGEPLPPPPEALPDQFRSLPTFATSARTGRGLPALRAWLQQSAAGGGIDAGASLRQGLGQAEAAVARALAAAATEAAELVAVEVHAALRALDGIAGNHDPDALLDRIHGRFCLGK